MEQKNVQHNLGQLTEKLAQGGDLGMEMQAGKQESTKRSRATSEKQYVLPAQNGDLKIIHTAEITPVTGPSVLSYSVFPQKRFWQDGDETQSWNAQDGIHPEN